MSGSGRSAVPIILSLMLLVLFYSMGFYMLNPIIRTLREEGLIPGATEVEWRFYAGLIGTVLQGVGLASSLILGYFADRFGRRPVIFAAGLMMGAGLLLVSAATSYFQLLSFFVLFGVGFVGIGPAIYAFISDAVPSESRGKGYAAYYASSVVAMILGLIVAGILLHWRPAYALAGAMTLLFTTTLFMLSKGVTIGYSEKRESAAGGSSLKDALPSLKKRSVLLILLMIIPWTIPWGMLSYWSVDYLVAKWGVSRETASLVLALATASIAAGHVVGGSLSDKMAGKGEISWRAKISLVGVIVGYLFMLTMLLYPYPYGRESLESLLPPALIAVGGMMFTTFAYPNISTVMSDVVPPEHRGKVFAVYGVLNNLGWTLGPSAYAVTLGLVSRIVGNSVQAMTYSASMIVSLWIFAAICWAVLVKTYPKEKL
ncbi:MAG: MFS transporter [Thermofilum sp.]